MTDVILKCPDCRSHVLFLDGQWACRNSECRWTGDDPLELRDRSKVDLLMGVELGGPL